ncbi:MAG: glycosyltransferase [Treponema sp.]|nr:glycosyltransferase [Treponema sp.]
MARCLSSVYKQDFDSFEIIIVSDASPGKDLEGRSAKKIVKAIKKECKAYRKENKLAPVKIKFVEHSVNQGILEVRRTFSLAASGKYIFSVDSDDEILPGTLKTLYNTASLSDYDIVHCTFIPGYYDEKGEFILSDDKKCSAITYGEIPGKEILSSWLRGGLSSCLPGKIVKRTIYTKAYKNIPYAECNMGDDILIFFFISQYAKSYIGIQDKLYRYQIDSGMTSRRKIDTLKKCRLLCSSSSVFTVISQWIKKADSPKISDEDVELIRKMTRDYLCMVLIQLNRHLIPELRKEAREMLNEYWGKSFVDRMENFLIAVSKESVEKSKAAKEKSESIEKQVAEIEKDEIESEIKAFSGSKD